MIHHPQRGLGSVACEAGEDQWIVVTRNANYSAFNGYRFQWSRYSLCACRKCGWLWRTKAGYVKRLPDGPPREWRSVGASP